MIRIEDVSVSYGDVAVFDGVTAAVEEGTFVGLVGPNGAGKTTLLRAINGVISPDDGEVRVAGRRVADLSAAEASRLVATVPQDTHLSFAFDVRQVVAMGRNPYIPRFGSETSTDGEVVERAMERTAVGHLADRDVDAVSGGERRRVVLARALAQDAPVLLLDEPTASLDVNHQVRTLDLVADLVAEGKTAVAAIHDLDLAARYCDELLVLADGRVLASGPPDEVLTEETLAEAFDVRAAVGTHPVTGSPQVTALSDREDDRRARVHVVAGGATASGLLHRLDAAGFAVSVGALPAGDADLATARQLGVDVVTTPPHQPVDEATAREVRERVRAADVTVVADVAVTEGNLPNLEAARDADRLVLVGNRAVEERNRAGQRGRRVYEDLRARARGVAPGDVVAAVESAVESPPAGLEDAVPDGRGE